MWQHLERRKVIRGRRLSDRHDDHGNFIVLLVLIGITILLLHHHGSSDDRFDEIQVTLDQKK